MKSRNVAGLFDETALDEVALRVVREAYELQEAESLTVRAAVPRVVQLYAPLGRLPVHQQRSEVVAALQRLMDQEQLDTCRLGRVGAYRPAQAALVAVRPNRQARGHFLRLRTLLQELRECGALSWTHSLRMECNSWVEIPDVPAVLGTWKAVDCWRCRKRMEFERMEGPLGMRVRHATQRELEAVEREAALASLRRAG